MLMASQILLPYWQYYFYYLGVVHARIFEHGGLPREEPGALHAHLHVGQLSLDGLEAGYGLVEGLALGGVVQGTVYWSLCDPQGLACDAYSTRI